MVLAARNVRTSQVPRSAGGTCSDNTQQQLTHGEFCCGYSPCDVTCDWDSKCESQCGIDSLRPLRHRRAPFAAFCSSTSQHWSTSYSCPSCQGCDCGRAGCRTTDPHKDCFSDSRWFVFFDMCSTILQDDLRLTCRAARLSLFL